MPAKAGTFVDDPGGCGGALTDEVPAFAGMTQRGGRGGRTARRAAAVFLAAGLLAGCNGLPRFDDAPPPLPPTEADRNAPLIGLDLGGDEAAAAPADLGPYDRQAGEAALARGRDAEAAGDIVAAADAYREAGLAGPDLVDAWRGLSRAAARGGDPTEVSAARFVAGRVDLYPAEDLATQREARLALERWIEEQYAAPEANELRLAYAEHLATYWATLYRARGPYEAPARFLNAERRDLPAVLLSSGAGIWYFVSIFGSTGGG
jgi:hypothetical protein